jgi:histidine phosphotransferase ChpT
VPADEPRDLIAGLISANERIEFEWAVADATLPKPAVKVLLNLAAIATDALVRGGTLAVGAERRDGATEIAVRAAGPRVAFDGNIGKALDGSLAARELTGRTAPAHMIRLLAEELGGGLQYALSAEALVMGAVLPDRIA